MNRHTRSVLTLALIALALPSRGDEAIPLTFGWPDEVRATVSFEGLRERERGEARQSRTMAGSYRLATRRVDDGLLIEVRDMTIDDASDTTGRDNVQEILGRIGATIPDHVVGDDGKIVRIVGAAALRESMKAAIGEALAAQPPELRARIERALDATLTAQQLEANVRNEWNRDIGNWAGLALEPGRVYEGDTSAKVPMLPGEEVRTRVRYRLVERRPCSEESTTLDCVALEMETAVGQEDAAAVAESLARNLSARTGRDIRIERLAVESRVNLLTEPETLRPHEVDFSRRTILSYSAAGAPPQTHSQHERRISRYRYE